MIFIMQFYVKFKYMSYIMLLNLGDFTRKQYYQWWIVINHLIYVI